MDNQQLNDELTQYPVRVWEVILIVMGAITLIGAGLVGLVIKASTNALDPARAEAIAKSLINYKIPGGSQGIFGINIGSAKLAWVRSSTNPADVVLFIGKTPINKDTDDNDPSDGFEGTPSNSADENFSITASHIENKELCGKTVPVTIEQGQQTLTNHPSPMPAIRYIASITENDIKRVVILTTNGENASSKAATVFNSLRCK